MAIYKRISFGDHGKDAIKDDEVKTKPPVTPAQEQKEDISSGNSTSGSTGGTQSTASGNPTQPAATTPAQATAPAFEYGTYQPSEAVTQAEALLQQQLAQKPGAYQPTWQGQIDEIIGRILNREKFSYDLNGDALYQQYADQYVNQGRLAMMDTMGQAAGLTGGYGNSYGQNVGQQAYQGYLQQLNDVVPELYQVALNQYLQEGDAMHEQAALLMQQDEQDYGRYRDQLSDYYTELDRLTEDARYLGETDYDRYLDEYSRQYGEHRDTVADQQWQAEFDEAKRQYDQQYALSASKSSGGGSSSSDAAPVYTKLTHSDRQLMRKEVAAAKSVDELTALVNLYLGMGYDPATVNSMTKAKATELMKTSGSDDLVIPDRSGRLYGAGRVGFAG